jgi:preprotein translocase subunit SecG
VTIFLTVLHVLACLFLIVIVLLQRGKGAEMGAVFGGGAGATVFGSRGAGNFLTRMTTAAAIVFMVTSLTLAYIAQDRTGDTLFEGEEAPAAEDTFGEPPPAAGEAPGAFEEVTPPAPPEAPAAEAAPEAKAQGAEPAPAPEAAP